MSKACFIDHERPCTEACEAYAPSVPGCTFVSVATSVARAADKLRLYLLDHARNQNTVPPPQTTRQR